MLPLMLALVLFVPAAAASERADKPVLRSAAPSHVAAPRDPPEKDQPARVRAAEKPQGDTHAKININTADVKSLMTLTGVGRKVAERIVEYRDSHGPFKKSDEIRKVEGVGHGVWERNRDRIVTK
jgi:competence ComEA-like helix-hairpin-helix protein